MRTINFNTLFDLTQPDFSEKFQVGSLYDMHGECRLPYNIILKELPDIKSNINEYIQLILDKYVKFL